MPKTRKKSPVRNRSGRLSASKVKKAMKTLSKKPKKKKKKKDALNRLIAR